MKQLLILSGKGGTGKTTIAGAFIHFSKAKVYADCDVDAPNLHLSFAQNTKAKISDYFELPKAIIDTARCTVCIQCFDACRFDAIRVGKTLRVDPVSCEGCGVCQVVCPVDAVSFKPAKAGKLKQYISPDHIFSTAELKIGSGTSGKLVTEVKKGMKTAAETRDVPLAVIDGSPGIGCPVIASISGVDMVLVVTEPSLSGISDLERVVKTAKNFGVKIAVCINKANINRENTRRIQTYCEVNRLPVVGKIPFDKAAVKAINNGKTIAQVDSPAGRAAKTVYDRVMVNLIEG